MKKTLSVNLNGRVFNVDEDAYQLLDNYLKNLRIYFRNEEGSAEIIADFEARIEELFSDRVRLGYSVISIEDTEKVIAQMGRPDDFGEREENDPTGEKDQHEKNRPEEYMTVKKKLYRNPDDKMFGGVCSGIATYCDWNVTIVRIIAAILVPATSLWIVPAYLICWLVVPEARTAEQKLEMQGKPITIENIGKMVASGLDDVKKAAHNSGCLASLVDFIVALFKVCLVGLGCLIGIPLIFALVIIIIVLFATLFGVGTGILGELIPWTNETFLFVDRPALATAAFCLITGIPLVALIYTIISNLFKLKPVHKGVKWAGIILWLAAVIALPFSGFKADWSKLTNNNHWKWEWNGVSSQTDLYGDGNLTERLETLSPVHSIEVNGSLEINLQIEQSADGENSLLINGDSNLIDKIMMRTTAQDLVLWQDKHYNLHPTTPVVVRLRTSIPIDEIEATGASHVHLVGGLRTEKLDIDASGAAGLDLYDIHTDRLNADASGASVINLSGDTRQAELDASGAAKIHAGDLVSETISADVSGTGFVRCNPVQSLTGEASGVGQIVYRQDPKHKNINTSGMGKIEKE